MITEAKLLCMA